MVKIPVYKGRSSMLRSLAFILRLLRNHSWFPGSVPLDDHFDYYVERRSRSKRKEAER